MEELEKRISFSKSWCAGYRGLSEVCWGLIDGQIAFQSWIKFGISLRDLRRISTPAQTFTAVKEPVERFIVFTSFGTKKFAKSELKRIGVKNFSVEEEWYGERFDVWVTSLEDVLNIWDNLTFDKTSMSNVGIKIEKE